MHPTDQAVTEARAALMQPLLRAVAAHMPPAGMAALRAELAALERRAAGAGTPQGAAMAQACAMALADLGAL